MIPSRDCNEECCFYEYFDDACIITAIYMHHSIRSADVFLTTKGMPGNSVKRYKTRYSRENPDLWSILKQSRELPNEISRKILYGDEYLYWMPVLPFMYGTISFDNINTVGYIGRHGIVIDFMDCYWDMKLDDNVQLEMSQKELTSLEERDCIFKDDQEKYNQCVRTPISLFNNVYYSQRCIIGKLEDLNKWEH